MEHSNSAEFNLPEHSQLGSGPAGKTVVVGMSGGVDSSVTALILKKLGFNVIGLFMKNWEELDENGQCTSEQDYADVAATCAQIDIPFRAINFIEEYRNNVFKSFLDDYKSGHTPNPDILCNKEIKFKVFYKKAMELGADFLATGHYCITDGTLLKKGFDPGKDQSYFLYAIDKNVLKNVIFPLGHLHKKQVREIATKFDLPTKAKKDSTGICFIGERDFRDFLSQYIQSQKGCFQTVDGEIVGEHEGACFYTIGQRKKLGLGGQGDRWFVVDKDIDKNIVFVARGDHPKLYTQSLILSDLNWLGDTPSFPLNCTAKIRYRQVDQKCSVDILKSGHLEVTFHTPQKGAATRQSVVLYQDSVCLGGGLVKELGKNFHELGLSVPS